MRRLLALLLLAVPGLIPPGGAVAAENLLHERTIGQIPLQLNFAESLAGADRFFRLKRPTAIAVLNQDLYFYDQFERRIIRLDLDRSRISILDNASSTLGGDVPAMAITRGGELFVADPFNRAVRQLDLDGNLRRTIQDPRNLSNPVGIVPLPFENMVLVADRMADHVIRFTPIGWALSAFGRRGNAPGEVADLIDIAAGPEGIYLLSRLNKHIAIFDSSTNLIRTIDRSAAQSPTALCVDEQGRVYVADSFDNTIKVYWKEALIETVGSMGSANGQFMNVQDLACDGQRLFVADSDNARIQIFHIEPRVSVPLAPIVTPPLPVTGTGADGPATEPSGVQP